jgi:hypothetical protein
VLLEIGSRRSGGDTCCYPDDRVIVEPGLRVRPYGDGVLDDQLAHEQNDARECNLILRAHLDGTDGRLGVMPLHGGLKIGFLASHGGSSMKAILQVIADNRSGPAFAS